jgi:hypothetical protein
MEKIPLKWVFFGLLILLQTLVGVLYKISQKDGQYRYSTFSAMTLAELGKLGISVTLLSIDDHFNLSALQSKCSRKNVLSLSLLAGLYFLNNQLAFHLFLLADPASVNLIKAGSSLITAGMWCLLMGQTITQNQWSLIACQVCGLIVVQIDGCRGVPILPTSAYVALGISTVLTALSSVWNEYQLKSIAMSLHEQNCILYCFGVGFNAFGHMYKTMHDPEYPSFLEGFTPVIMLIVAVNACFGVVVTALYKYADAVLKTLASACTTVLLLILSFCFFNLEISLVRICGCIVVVLSVAQYAILPANKSDVLPWRTRSLALIGLLGVCVAAGIYLL